MSASNKDEEVPEEVDTTPILRASLRDVSTMVAVLKAINNLATTATIMLSKAGIQIEVEHRRALQATAYLRHSMFEEYTFTAPTGGEGSDEEEGEKSVEFDINLGILNETLSIYGTSTGTSTGTGKRRKWKAGRQGDEDDDQPHGTLDNFFKPFGRTKTTSMRMSYDGDGHPLKLLLAERAEGPTTTCLIHTLLSERIIDLEFSDEEKIVKMIMKSYWLRDALSDIDSSCEYITIICNPRHQTAKRGKVASSNTASVSFFRIEAKSNKGSLEIEYPDDPEVLEHFDCAESIRFNYNFPMLQQAVRALAVSLKVSLRINQEGMMSLQFLMPSRVPGESNAWIEFKCLARQDNL